MLENILGAELLALILLILTCLPFIIGFMLMANGKEIVVKFPKLYSFMKIYMIAYLIVLISLFFVPVEFLDWLL